MALVVVAYLVDVEVVVDPVSEQREALQVSLGARLIIPLGWPSIGSQMGSLLSENGLSFGEALLL